MASTAELQQGRRRMGKWMLALAAGGLLASCASLVGPRRVEISQARLQAGLERRFPINNRMLQLLDVQLAQPQLTIQPESDRVALGLGVTVAPPFLHQSWRGSMALSGRLVLDPSRNAVFLTDTHLDRFDVDGIDADRARDLGRAADVLVNQMVRDVAVYSFRPEDLRYG